MKRGEGKKGNNDEGKKKKGNQKRRKENPPLTAIIMKGFYANWLKLILHLLFKTREGY